MIKGLEASPDVIGSPIHASRQDLDLVEHPGSQSKGDGSLGPFIRDVPIEDLGRFLRGGCSGSRDWTRSKSADDVPQVHGLKVGLHLVGPKLVIGAIELRDVFV